MQRSTARILTTHTGSLPRPDDLVGMVEGRNQQGNEHAARITRSQCSVDKAHCLLRRPKKCARRPGAPRYP